MLVLPRKKGVITKGVFSLEESLESLKFLNCLESLENGRTDSPLFSTLWGISRISKISRFSSTSRKWAFLKRPLFSKRPLFPIAINAGFCPLKCWFGPRKGRSWGLKCRLSERKERKENFQNS